MSSGLVRIRELAAWGLDDYPHRPAALHESIVHRTGDSIAKRRPFSQAQVLLEAQTERTREFFDSCAGRQDLLAEMAGLSWSLGIVDIRQLIAFQRRLAFPTDFAMPPVPKVEDWRSLFALSFGPPKPVKYEMRRIRDTDISGETFILESENPDLHLRSTRDLAAPFSVHAGGPFFEVACFRERWFLRDGYHRAYALLEAGVFAVPAVIIQAASLIELGANGPWFFAEDVLFSQTPPRIIDFLEQELVIEYTRAPFLKTIRIHIEENLTPATLMGEQS